MTRINVGVDPAELSTRHLIAELREIKRIPNLVKCQKISLASQPKQFKLGTGHVKFFYDKLKYLKIRYDKLYLEACRRKFNVTYFGSAWDGIPECLNNDYVETPEDRQLILERMVDNAANRKIRAA